MKRLFAVLTMLLFANTAIADKAAEQIFEKGISEFEKQNYSLALSFFEEAQSKGMDDPKLTFNLGVTLYKLTRYAEAKPLFIALTENREFRDRAYLNLGLLAVREEQYNAAEIWLRKILDHGKSPQIQRLAREVLRRINKDDSSLDRLIILNLVRAYESEPDWERIDNGATPAISSSFTELNLTAETRLARYGFLRNVGVEGFLFVREPDSGILPRIELYTLGLGHHALWDSFSLDSVLNYNLTRIYKEDYTQSYSLQLDAKHNTTKKLRFDARYQAEKTYKTVEYLSYDSGMRHRIRLGARYSLGQSSSWLRLRYEYDQTKHEQRPDDIYLFSKIAWTSISPTRKRVDADGRLRLFDRWIVGAGGSYRESEYDVPSLSGEFRRDRRYRAYAALVYELTKNIDIEVSYQLTVTRSTNKASDTNREQIGIAASLISF
ncbi:MAG: tetratricopeptide repeat protein [Gammaproteobacteria bacterium]|nr:tetratricopeptide repeat protein [Gammaproteobacteria bacterium]